MIVNHRLICGPTNELFLLKRVPPRSAGPSRLWTPGSDGRHICRWASPGTTSKLLSRIVREQRARASKTLSSPKPNELVNYSFFFEFQVNFCSIYSLENLKFRGRNSPKSFAKSRVGWSFSEAFMGRKSLHNQPQDLHVEQQKRTWHRG